MEKLKLRVVALMKMIMVVLMCAVSVSLITTTIVPCVDAASKKPQLYKVGDSDNGWRPEFDYMVWARKHDFHVGDSLYFGYDQRNYSVLEVNKTDYETCKSGKPIAKISRGDGRDVFNLTSAKSFYFLSGGGYCFQGMRLAITVKKYAGAITNLEPAPPLPMNGSPTSNSGKNVISTIIIGGAIILAWYCF